MVCFQEENDVMHFNPELGHTQSENSGMAHELMKEEDLAKVSDPLHGTNFVWYEGDCPYCGREIVQDLLHSELESADKTVPLNSSIE
jgi:hypothetical protein